MWVSAAEGASAASPLDFLQYGVLGLVIVALLVGWLWAKPSVDQMRADKTAVEAQRDALIEAYETQVIPVLTSVQREFVPATSSMADALRVLQRETLEERKELRKSIQRLTDEISQLRRSGGTP